MFPWLTPWFNGSTELLNVTQDINPFFGWKSPQVEINFAGNRNIENSIIKNTASYGTQLGLLSKVVLELAGDQKSATIDKLKELTDDINTVKRIHKSNLEQNIRSELDRLKLLDANAVQKILTEYQQH